MHSQWVPHVCFNQTLPLRDDVRKGHPKSVIISSLPQYLVLVTVTASGSCSTSAANSGRFTLTLIQNV